MAAQQQEKNSWLPLEAKDLSCNVSRSLLRPVNWSQDRSCGVGDFEPSIKSCGKGR